MSLSFPISSPSLRFPIPPLSLCPSFLYYYPQPPHGYSAKFVLCHYRLGGGKSNLSFDSMKIKRVWGCRCSSSFSSFGEDAGEVCDNGSEDDEDERDDEEEGDFGSPLLLPERWDVLGLGQAMVDFSGTVDDEFLKKLGLEKGTRKVVNHEERGRILQAMDGCSYKAAAGGSLSNSLVALARLGSRPIGGPIINVAMAGSVGSDPLGSFYRATCGRADRRVKCRKV